MFPSVAASRPLSRWTDGLGWLGGSGPPTLDRKPQKNFYIKKKKKEQQLLLKRSKWTCKFKSYFQRSVPPWVRRERCFVSHPRRRACRPGLLWLRCAVGSDVCPHSAEELYPRSWVENNLSVLLIMKGKSKIPCKSFQMMPVEILQGEDLWGRVALLSEVPQLELADRVHRQNLCCPQISHRMNRAAVCVLWQLWNSPIKHVSPKETSVITFYCEMLQLILSLTYDSDHCFLVGSEDDDPAVFTDRNDLGAAAHDTSAGGVVTGVTMRPRPVLSNWYRLQTREREREDKWNETFYQTTTMSCVSC